MIVHGRTACSTQYLPLLDGEMEHLGGGHLEHFRRCCVDRLVAIPRRQAGLAWSRFLGGRNGYELYIYSIAWNGFL